MNFVKKMFLMLTIAMLSLSLAACGEEEKKAETKKTETKKEETKKETKSEVVKVSDDLYAFEVLLDGKLYKLPIDYSELEKDGWKTDEDISQTMEPGSYSMGTPFTKGDQKISVSFVNNGVDVKPMSECQVGGIESQYYDEENVPNISIAKGIEIGSTMDEVIEAFGEPTDKSESETYTELTYSNDSYKDVKIEVDPETNKVTDISVRNLISEEEPAASTADSGDAPEVVKNYQAPTSLGDDIFSFQVNYSGNLYKLPAPVSAFEANGWVVEGDMSQQIPAGQSLAIGYSIRKDNKVCPVYLTNYADTATSVSNCFVTHIKTDQHDAAIPMELPKGITEKSTGADVLAAYGEPTEREDTSSFVYYIYGTYPSEISFTVNKDDDTISSIEFDVDPDELQ